MVAGLTGSPTRRCTSVSWLCRFFPHSAAKPLLLPAREQDFVGSGCKVEQILACFFSNTARFAHLVAPMAVFLRSWRGLFCWDNKDLAQLAERSGEREWQTRAMSPQGNVIFERGGEQG